jgi:hypothetical protein
VDDSKPTRDHNADAKAVDILRINMYLLRKIIGCWFCVGVGFSTIYLRLDFHHSAGIPKTSCCKIFFFFFSGEIIVASHKSFRKAVT